jgi:hypothetical protein
LNGDAAAAEGVVEIEMQTMNWKSVAVAAVPQVELVFNTLLSSENAAKFSVNGTALNIDYGDGSPIEDVVCTPGLGVNHAYSGSSGIKTVKFTPGPGVDYFDVSQIVLPLDGDGPKLYSMANIPITLNILYLQYNAFTTDTVNSLLIELDNNGGAYGEVYISNQDGSGAAPSGGGITAKANLIGKGWTVVTD